MSSIRRRFALLSCAAAVVLIGALGAPAASEAWYTPPPNCGGATYYKADGTKWVCSFDDEFNGNYLDTTKWTVVQTPLTGFTTGPTGSQVCYVNNRNNVYVSGGVLNLTVRKEAAPFNCNGLTTQYTGGTVNTSGRFSQTYGRFEVRAKFPSTTVAGLQETLWLWPTNATRYGAEPASGEIDFAEAYSQYPNLDVPYVHYTPAAYDKNMTSYNCTLSTSLTFHTYTLVWTTTTLTISYDGQTCLTDTWNPAAPLSAPEPFDQPFFLVLTQALGIGSNAYTSATPLPATTQVDYARIWK
jgi:beta-glucanase (GH16 family)